MMNEACELNCVVFTMALRSDRAIAHGVLHRVSASCAATPTAATVAAS